MKRINFLPYVLQIQDEKSWQAYDYVFLTCGTFAYHDPYNLKGKKGYIATPYPTYNTLDEVNQLDDVQLLVRALPFADVVRYVAAHHPKFCPITMTSRSAHLPSVRGTMIDVTFKYLTKDKFKMTLKNIISAMHRLILFSFFIFKRMC